MNSESDIINMNQMIMNVFNNISIEKSENANSIIQGWKKVLLRIKSNRNPHEGENLASHSKVIDLKNGVLFVETDHPGWIELLQLHQKFILNGIKMDFPQLKVETIAYKLGGKKDDLTDNRSVEEKSEDTRRMIEKRLQIEEEANKKLNFSSGESEKKVEMPQELVSIFAELKKDMLTNTKN